MQQHAEVVTDLKGNVVPNASVRVLLLDGSLATIYPANGGQPGSNPIVTDANGLFKFYAPNGRYKTEISIGNNTFAGNPDIVLFDPAEASFPTLTQLASPSGAALVNLGDSPIADYLLGDDMPVPAARGYWNEVGTGVNIHRLGDRVFIGGGATSSGNKIQEVSETWLTGDIGAYWLERGAQVLALSTYGQFGGVFAARTSDQALHDYGTAAIGVAGVANNDRASGTGLAWGGYFEANRQASVPTGQGTVFGIELAVKNNRNDVTNGPYNRLPGGATIGAWFAGGGDPAYNGPGTTPVTCAILIGKNAATWNKGLVFDATGITGTDGVTGTGIAISMAKGHVVEWQIAGNTQGATIHSEVTSSSQRTGLRFNNDQVWFTAAGSLVGTIEKGASTAAYLRMISGGGTNPAQIKATSSETDADLLLNPQGAGTVRFGFHTANADAPVTGYIGIKDAAGTFRKLAVIA